MLAVINVLRKPSDSINLRFCREKNVPRPFGELSCSCAFFNALDHQFSSLQMPEKKGTQEEAFQIIIKHTFARIYFSLPELFCNFAAI